MAVSHFQDDDYGAYFQNWAITQDHRGILYVANKDGILRYDGKTWILIKTDRNTTVRSIAVSAGNTVFVGEQGDFGYLEPDSTGVERFISLQPFVPEEFQSFNDVWNTLAIGEDIYFQTSRYIFRWNGTSIKVWTSESGFHTTFSVNETLYVREREIGLQSLTNNQFELVSSGELFSDSKIYGVLPHQDGNSILIATRDQGLYLLREERLERVPNELDDYLKMYRLYCSAPLGNGLFAFGTLRGGVVIATSEGKIVYLIEEPLITDEVIRYIYPDSENGLWIATNSDGIFRFELPFSLSKFDNASGLQGGINSISRINGVITVGSLTGAFSLSSSTNTRNKFVQLENVPATWQISQDGERGFAATEEGTYLIEPFRIVQIDRRQSYSVQPTGKSGESILIGGGNSLFYYKADSGGDYQLELTQSFLPLIRSVINLDSDIWLGTRANGVIRIHHDGDFNSGQEIFHYTGEHGLPLNTKINILKSRSRPIFYSEFGPYRFIEEEDRFELDEELWPFEDGRSDSLFTMTEDHHGNVWMVFPDSVVKATPNSDGSYRFTAPEALKFRKTSTSSILVEDDDVVWFNDGDELIRYDPKLDLPAEFSYNALVSSVSVNGQPDAIHNGSFRGPNGGAVLDQPNWAIPTLNYDQKDLSFRVAATTYTAPDDIRFQIWLEGKDESWSKWSVQYEYYITGLHEGSYTFRVRARNTAGRLSREAGYSFVILPPWYRTWWAYFLYVTLGSLVVYSVQKYFLMWRAHKLAAEQAEELLREREVNKVLQEANERLTKANRLKDEFLATTSHELRTPLTAILGFTSVLREEIPDGAEYLEFLDIIEDSGSRLMETLNSLLDLAKLRANMMEINLEPCDLYYQCINGISDLEATAERKGLKLHVERPSETLFVDLDVLGFLRILQNLIGNAIKFTETGFVKVVLEADGDFVHMKICDSGIGIDEEFLPRLFDEFMQESDGPSRSYEGFGLGLAITVRLVRLMHGDLSVESKKGEGSQFTVTFPRAEPITGASISVKGFGNVDEQSW